MNAKTEIIKQIQDAGMTGILLKLDINGHKATKQMILEYLAQHPEGATATEIAQAAVRLNGATAAKLGAAVVRTVYLPELRREGKIVSRRDPFGLIDDLKGQHIYTLPEVPRETQPADDKGKTETEQAVYITDTAVTEAACAELEARLTKPRTDFEESQDAIDYKEKNGSEPIDKPPYTPAQDDPCELVIEYDGRKFEARGPYAAVNHWYEQFLDSLGRVHGRT